MRFGHWPKPSMLLGKSSELPQRVGGLFGGLSDLAHGIIVVEQIDIFGLRVLFWHQLIQRQDSLQWLTLAGSGLSAFSCRFSKADIFVRRDDCSQTSIDCWAKIPAIAPCHDAVVTEGRRGLVRSPAA